MSKKSTLKQERLQKPMKNQKPNTPPEEITKIAEEGAEKAAAKVAIKMNIMPNGQKDKNEAFMNLMADIYNHSE